MTKNNSSGSPSSHSILPGGCVVSHPAKQVVGRLALADGTVFVGRAFGATGTESRDASGGRVQHGDVRLSGITD